MPNSEESLMRISELERNFIELSAQIQQLKADQAEEKARLEALLEKAQKQLQELESDGRNNATNRTSASG